MAVSAMSALSADEIDDLLYLTRVNEAAELQQTISDLVQTHNCSPSDVITSGIDPESGNTMLHYASANGFSDLVKSFIGQLDSIPTAASGTEPHGHPQPLFINRTNNEGNTALHWAAYNGNLDVVKGLIEAGADMWIKNAAGHYAMFEAERAEKSDVAQYLLEKGGEAVESSASGSQSVSEDVADAEDVEMSMQAEASSSSGSNANHNGTR